MSFTYLNWLKKLENKPLVLLIVLALSSGCTAFVSKPMPPTPPNFTADLTGSVKWPSPNKPAFYKYETVQESKNPVTIDDVTVEVLSISEEAAASNYLIECADPNDKPITFPLPPTAQVRITNGTDHLIALGQTAMLTGTVIRLEDKQGNEYDLYSGIGDWRAEAQKPISDYYSRCLQVADAEYATAIDNYKKEKEGILDNYENELNGEYAKKYEEYISDFETQNRLECINPLWILGMVMSEGKMEEDKADTTISPDNLWFKSSAEFSLEAERLTQKTNVIKVGIQQAINKKKSECLVKVAQMKPKKTIYSGAYPTITIFPKKSIMIYIPFIKKEGDYLDRIKFMLYDLPTRMDAAGMPTKRSNFDIMLRRTEKN